MQSFKVKWEDYAMLIVDILMNIKHFGVKLIAILGLLILVYMFIPKSEDPEKKVGQQELSSYTDGTIRASKEYSSTSSNNNNISVDEDSFLGTWESGSDTLEITSRGDKGRYTVTLTVYPWPAGYATWTYEADYNAKTGNLDCRNGVRIDHGKFASDTTLVYDGDGAAEILVSDGESLSFVSTSACPEDEDTLPSPIIFRADSSASAPESSVSAPTGNDLSEYYGDYEYGPAFIHIGEGDSDNSLYIHVAYEPTASMWDPMHGNVPIDADAHFLFETDRTPDSQNIDVDGNKIVGAVSIEKMSDSSLYVIIYKKQGDDDPYQFMITPD